VTWQDTVGTVVVAQGKTARRDKEYLWREGVRLRMMELRIRGAQGRRMRKLQQRNMRVVAEVWDKEINLVVTRAAGRAALPAFFFFVFYLGRRTHSLGCHPFT
jgi:hypothetical protein